MENEYGNIELSDPDDSFSLSSIVNLDCSNVGVSCDPDSVWIPSTGNIFFFFSPSLIGNGLTFCLFNLLVVIRFHLQTFDLSEIHGMLTAYIGICGGFRHVVNKYY